MRWSHILLRSRTNTAKPHVFVSCFAALLACSKTYGEKEEEEELEAKGKIDHLIRHTTHSNLILPNSYSPSSRACPVVAASRHA